MEFDQEHLRPTYRLLVGVPGTSSGIEIARRLGLPERVVEYAQRSLSPESREARDLIAYLHRSRDEMEEIKRQSREELSQLESERRSLRGEWVDRQKKRIAELERNFQETVKRLEGEVALVTAGVRDRILQAQLEKQSGKRLTKFSAEARADTNAAIVETLASSQSDLGVALAGAPKPIEPEQLLPGMLVQVSHFKQPIVFRRHDGRMAEVEAGPLRMRVPLGDVIGIAAEGPKPSKSEPGTRTHSRGVTVQSRPTEEPAETEINVIGNTVEQATERVDKFLDVAALAGRPSVRIIHGHGTGALRRGLAQFLSAHPLVESIRHEAEDHGGTAITIAELKG
jgi:DNA mismatch repair protein MutS2